MNESDLKEAQDLALRIRRHVVKCVVLPDTKTNPAVLAAALDELCHKIGVSGLPDFRQELTNRGLSPLW